MGNQNQYKKYFRVKNPYGVETTILAETEFEARARAVEKDNGKFRPKQYTVKKLK